GLRSLKRTLDDRLPQSPTSPWFEATSDGVHRAGVMLWRPSAGIASSGDRQALAAVRRIVAEVQPERFDRRMRVQFTGHIPQAIEDQDSIRADLTIATAICTVLILLVIYLYFRRVALVALVGVPALLGLLVALAIAALAIHSLNLTTAFLISIIL